MIIPKPSLAKVGAVCTILGLLVTWFFTAKSAAKQSEKEKQETLINQHDRDKSFDSLRTAFIIFFHDFQELQKSRTAINKQRDQDKKEDDERTEGLNLRLTKIEQWKEDFLFYNYYKKQKP